MTGGNHQEWMFLTRFGVGTSENLAFYLRILSCILDTIKSASSLSDPSRIFRLYESIQSQCWGSEEKEWQAEAVWLVLSLTERSWC
jgi:hypothetical protein